MLRHYSANAERTINVKNGSRGSSARFPFYQNSPYKTSVDTGFGAQDDFGSACVCVFTGVHWSFINAARPTRPCGLQSMLRSQETDSQTFTDMQSSHCFSQKPALVNLHTCRRARSLSQHSGQSVGQGHDALEDGSIKPNKQT